MAKDKKVKEPRVKIGDVWESKHNKSRVVYLSSSGGRLDYQNALTGGRWGKDRPALVSSFVRGRKLVERDGKAV